MATAGVICTEQLQCYIYSYAMFEKEDDSEIYNYIKVMNIKLKISNNSRSCYIELVFLFLSHMPIMYIWEMSYGR